MLGDFAFVLVPVEPVLGTGMTWSGFLLQSIPWLGWLLQNGSEGSWAVVMKAWKQCP